MALSSAQKAEIQALVAGGQKIEAVKRFRELTGVGLKEALYAVTQMTLGASEPAASKTHAPVASSRPAVGLDPKTKHQAESAALAALKEGDVIEAIQRYRKHSHLDLKASKDAVDALSVVHQSDGRVNAKVAATLVGLLREGKTQEAVTHLMTNVGYDEVESRAFLKKLKNLGRINGPASRGCGCGCFNGLFGFLLAMALLTVMFQGACNNLVKESSLYRCFEPYVLKSPLLKARVGAGAKMADWMLVGTWHSEGDDVSFRAYAQIEGASGAEGVWLHAERTLGQSLGQAFFVDTDKGSAQIFSGPLACQP